jgi:hypothetical protein
MTQKRSRKSVPWAGWGKVAPQGHARTVMLRDCGSKCFLGPKKSFPICSKGTCKINRKGVWAAYIRSRQWGGKKSKYKGRSRPRHKRSVYTKVAKKASLMLGKSRRRSRRRRSKRKSRRRSRRRSSKRKSRRRSRRRSSKRKSKRRSRRRSSKRKSKRRRSK